MKTRRLVHLILAFTFVLLGCKPAVRMQKSIEKQAAGDDPYKLAASIGVYAHEFPGDMQHLPGYARLLCENGYFKESIDLCDHILTCQPDDVYSMQTLAMACYNMMNYQCSLDQYRKILELQPRNASIEEEYQQTLLQVQLYSKVRHLDSLIGTSPGSYETWLERAGVLMKMREGKAAMADYAFYLDKHGYDRDVAFNRFRAAILSVLPAEAEKEVERIRQHSPEGDKLVDQMSRILTDTRNGLAKIKSSPEDASGYEMVAKSLVFLRMEPESIPYLEKAIRLDSLNAALSLRLAYVYAVSGRKGEAGKLLTKLKQQGKKIPDEILRLLE
jgi:tetratricopeptide (TPR) repeat protein